MCPAEGKRELLTPTGKRRIAAIAVNLQDAGEIPEMRLWPLCLAIGGIDIGDDRRVSPAPWPIVAGIGP